MITKSKILIVDDDPYILLSLEFLFKKNGYEVLIARNGTECLDLVEKEHPVLILLDIMMADMDGFSICEKIKSTPNLADIKIVFLSAKSKDTDIKKGYDLGASLYVTKPFSTRELVKQVKTLTEVS
ncbi:MAG: response regulator [Chitinophagales bacterium]